MGFLKDVRDLSALSKHASEGYDPAAQMRAATAQMQQVSAQTRLLQTGTDASATVLAVRDTGTHVNHQPMLEVDLTVLAQGGLPFPATATVTGHAQLAVLRPGASVRVRYDPDGPATMDAIVVIVSIVSM